LGIANYHWKFIKGYSSIARPLHDLTKDVPYDWTRECQNSFDQLKEALVMAPVLAIPNDDRKFRLETDASDVATGTVLSQQQSDGSYHLVGYASKSYNNAEKSYTTYDKEMLVVMRGLEEWQDLLIGAAEPFEILTNHRNLTYFRELQKLTSRQVNWTTKLQDYNFVIKHIDGTSNDRADALSRPDRVDKLEKKTATLLPDTYFVGLLIRKINKTEEPTMEEKAEAI
jgi:hypothetical protein